MAGPVNGEALKLLITLVVALVTGYGSAQYSLGGLEARVDTLTSGSPVLRERITAVETKVIRQKEDIDEIKEIVKEIRDIVRRP